MSTVHLSHDQTHQSDEGQAHGDSPLPRHENSLPSRGLPHCECEYRSTSQQVGTVCHLCQSPLRELHEVVTGRDGTPCRPRSDNHADWYVHQVSGSGQLHDEPLPFELIPFDSGQLLTLRAIELHDIDDFLMAVDILSTPMQADELDGDAYTVEYF